MGVEKIKISLHPAVFFPDLGLTVVGSWRVWVETLQIKDSVAFSESKRNLFSLVLT